MIENVNFGFLGIQKKLRNGYRPTFFSFELFKFIFPNISSHMLTNNDNKILSIKLNKL